MPNVVLKLGSVCPLPPPVEFCLSRVAALALCIWLGKSGAVAMVGVKPVVEEDMMLEEALLKVRPGLFGVWPLEGVG